MPTNNLFWSQYQALEKEFLKATRFITFDDNHLEVYSEQFIDILMRTWVEIEAISKKLYFDNGGQPKIGDDLYFDTDCIKFLDSLWHICDKELHVDNINFYFTQQDVIVFKPLHKCDKRGTSGSKWKQAYQAVKHDRRNSLKKATIENLLHAMGALYILNLYYKDERTDIGRVYLSDHNFDNRAGSEIFSAHCCHATCIDMAYHMDDSCINPPLGDELERSIYIIKYDDKSFREMHKNSCLDFQITEQRFNNSPEIAKFLSEHPEYKGKSINEICLAAGGDSLFMRIVCMQHSMGERSTRMEALLNKHSGIYPKLLPPTVQGN